MPLSAKERAIDDLRHRILTLEIAPGTDLDEAGLSAHYGLSRTPLREILQRLSGEGYVALTVHRGAKVASMDLATMRSFFLTAPLVYSSVARLAAANRTLAGLETLKDIQTDFSAAVGDDDAGQAALLNHAFHAQIGEMAGNDYLAPALGRLLIDHARLSRTFFHAETTRDQQQIRTAIAHHDEMIAAFEDGAPERAVAVTLEHWDLSRDQMERFVRPDPLPLDVRESPTREMKGPARAV